MKARTRLGKSLSRGKLRIDPPWLQKGEVISGQVTVGGSDHRTARPVLIGAEVNRMKRALGVCMRTETCRKIAGHGGECT